MFDNFELMIKKVFQLKSLTDIDKCLKSVFLKNFKDETFTSFKMWQNIQKKKNIFCIRNKD